MQTLIPVGVNWGIFHIAYIENLYVLGAVIWGIFHIAYNANLCVPGAVNWGVFGIACTK